MILLQIGCEKRENSPINDDLIILLHENQYRLYS